MFLKFELLTHLVLITIMKQTSEKMIIIAQMISLICLKNYTQNIIIFLIFRKLIN